MHRWDLTPSQEVLEHARSGAGNPLSVTSVDFHHCSTKMSFNVADAHCNVKIHDCLDSDSFGRHALCEAPVGISVHNALATKDPTLRTAKAVPGLQNLEVSITKSRAHENQRFRSEGLQKLGLFWIFTSQ